MALDVGHEEFIETLKKGPLPRHVAIIMDGNARWAQRRGLPSIQGYARGIEVAWQVAELSNQLGIEVLTLFAFSKENWLRPREEVDQLMGLLREYLEGEREKFVKSGMRLKVLGDLEDLPKTIRALLLETVEQSRGNPGTVVALALSYSGRWEIAQAARALAEKAKRGELNPGEIDERVFAQALQTADLPDPDLMIRTSGEKRISNFLLWQMAYTELYFTEVLWPDFTQKHFLEALLDYQGRERRFGRRKSRPESGP